MLFQKNPSKCRRVGQCGIILFSLVLILHVFISCSLASPFPFFFCSQFFLSTFSTRLMSSPRVLRIILRQECGFALGKILARTMQSITFGVEKKSI
jgi:hypothetical protein